MRPSTKILFALSLALPWAPALAEAAQGYRPLAGYECMSLNISDAQAHDFHFHVIYYSEPNAASPEVGYAGSQVAVRKPHVVVNGFAQALFPTGVVGWIEADLLRSYRSPFNPSTKCIPVMFSDGRRDFQYFP